MKDARLLTPAEFEVIEVLWQEEKPRSVGDVLRVVRRNRPVAYTTVMTVLDKLARKGSVARTKKGKAYYYTARVEKAEVLHSLVLDFAQQYFGGSRRRLRIFLGGPPSTSPQNVPSKRPEPEPLDIALL